MDTSTIVENEKLNDGKTICLYFNSDIGFYVAYGFSAFLAAHVVEPVLSLSLDKQMPVALIRRFEIMELKRNSTIIEHQERSFYKFELRVPIGVGGYDKWAKKISL